MKRFMLALAASVVGLSTAACVAPEASRKGEETAGVSSSAAESASDTSTKSGEEATSSADSTPSTPPSVESLTTSAELPSSGHGTDIVRGKVIDFWGHTLPGVAVGIGEDRVKTDERGEFEFSGVGPTYDVSAVVRFKGDVVEVYGWHYEGLTRRDPTLQVYKGLGQREAQVTFEVTGLQEPSVYAEAGLGGVHGQRAYSVSSAKNSVTAWRGAESIETVVHGVSFEAPQGPRVPTAYLSHNSSKVTLNDHGATSIALDLTSIGELPAANIRGGALPAREADRVNLVFARFDDGPTVLLVSELRKAESDTAFSYLAPSIDGMTLTVAVREDERFAQGEYSIGYVSGVIPGQDVGVIELNVPAEMHEPLEAAADVTKDTVCSWDTDSETAVVVFEDQQVFQAVYVVTANKQATLPDLSKLGLYYSNHGLYTWAVETHGAASSTDELVGEQGFLDPFSGDLNYPMGLRKGQGRFTRSGTRTFTTGKVTDSAFAR